MYEKLLPEILNEKLIGLQFAIEPAEVLDTLVLHVDDEVLKKNESRVFISKGEHSIFAEAEGYEPISFVYNFDSKSDFELALHFKKTELKEIRLEAKDSDASISLNAENHGSLPKQINLNQQTYLGLITDDEWSSFFLLQEKDFTKDTKQLSYLNFSIEDKIKKAAIDCIFRMELFYLLYHCIFFFAYYNMLLDGFAYGMGVPNNIDFGNIFYYFFCWHIDTRCKYGLAIDFYLNDANKVIPK